MPVVGLQPNGKSLGNMNGLLVFERALVTLDSRNTRVSEETERFATPGRHPKAPLTLLMRFRAGRLRPAGGRSAA